MFGFCILRSIAGVASSCHSEIDSVCDGILRLAVLLMSRLQKRHSILIATNLELEEEGSHATTRLSTYMKRPKLCATMHLDPSSVLAQAQPGALGYKYTVHMVFLSNQMSQALLSLLSITLIQKGWGSLSTETECAWLDIDIFAI